MHSLAPVSFEHSPDGLGIGRSRPRVSWRLPPGAADQDAYELELDRADGTETSGRVESGERHQIGRAHV